MDYKEKYEKAFSKATTAYKDEDRHLKATLERIFPELAGSEDEKIRKEIVEVFKSLGEGKIPTTINYANIFTYLEKQGEQKEVAPKFRVGDTIRNIKYPSQVYKITKIERWCYISGKTEHTSIRILITDQDKWELVEQKPADKVEPKFKVGQTIKKEGFNLGFTIVKIEDGFYYNSMGDYFPFTAQDNWELVEEKPAWSEEDEKMLNDILMCGERHCYLDAGNIAWLKSFKDRVQPQPKQEWKQENIEELSDFENAMMHIGGSFFGDNAGLNPNDTNAIKEQANLLLELVPSKEWSEEDIEILESCISLMSYNDAAKEETDWLKSLKERMKEE